MKRTATCQNVFACIWRDFLLEIEHDRWRSLTRSHIDDCFKRGFQYDRRCHSRQFHGVRNFSLIVLRPMRIMHVECVIIMKKSADSIQNRLKPILGNNIFDHIWFFGGKYARYRMRRQSSAQCNLSGGCLHYVGPCMLRARCYAMMRFCSFRTSQKCHTIMKYTGVRHSVGALKLEWWWCLGNLMPQFLRWTNERTDEWANERMECFVWCVVRFFFFKFRINS